MKQYDGTTTATVTPGTLNGVLAGDDVTVSAVATYDNGNVGTGKKITITYTLSGADAGKYTAPANTVLATGEIAKKALTITAPIVANKEYDGTNAATVTPGILSGCIGSDEVLIEHTFGTFDNANAGTNKIVNVSYVLTGAQAGNYILSNSQVRANITPKVITAPTPVLESATGKTTITLSEAITGLAAEDIFVIKEGDFLNLGTDYTVVITGTNVEITFTTAAKLAEGHVIAVAMMKENYAFNGEEPILVTNNIPSIIPQAASLWTNIAWGGNIVSYKYDDTLYLTLSGGTDGMMHNFGTNSNSNKLSSDGIKKVVILEGIVSIGKFAFFNNQLTSVTIPDGVQRIETGAFGFNQLTSVNIPSNVMTIGDIAFGSNKLESVTFKEWVYSISPTAFDGNGTTNTSAQIDASQTPGTFKLNEATSQWVKQP